MKEVTVLNNQNIFDISIQEFGSIEFINKILTDNDLPWNAELVTGQTLQINADNLGNNEVKRFYLLNNLTPSGGNQKELERPNFRFSTTLNTWDSTESTFDQSI